MVDAIILKVLQSANQTLLVILEKYLTRVLPRSKRWVVKELTIS